MKLTWIQRHALMVLLRNDAVRIKELTPPDIAANLFAYHLEGLVVEGIVEKAARGTYRLTTKGQKFAGTLSTLTEKKSDEIKTVVMLYGKRENEYLLFRWSRQPYLGKVTLVHDRMPFGKTLVEGIRTATSDKLGIELDAVYKTSTLVRIMHDGQQISHMNALIYEVNIDEIQFPFIGRNGEAFLGVLDTPGLMSGLIELIKHIEKSASPADITLEY